MNLKTVPVFFNGEEKQIPPGLKTGQELRSTVGAFDEANEQMLYELHGDVDVPVALYDQIIVVGGERFSIGNKHHGIEDNPLLRHPITFSLNEQEIDASKALKHAKVMVSDILCLDPEAEANSRLLADLEDLADEFVDAAHRLIVKRGDQFIVMPPREEVPCEVVVTIDDREVTLKAGHYTAAELKVLLGVAAGYDLAVWNGTEFVVVKDEGMNICKAESFASHARMGSSS